MKLNIRGIVYHVEMHQQQENLPLLVLLHGFMGSGKVFGRLIDRIKDFANPVTIDLLGHGRTEGIDTPDRYREDQQIEDLRTILSGFEEETIFLYGYSMGGRLALRYALRYPGTLTGLILESTHSGLDDEQSIQNRQQLDEQRAGSIEQDFSAFLEEWDNLPLFTTGIEVPPEYRKQYREIQSEQHPPHMAASLRGFGAARMDSVRSQLEKMHIPTLILAGEKDSKYIENGKAMHRKIPVSTFIKVPASGHRIHLENPAALAQEINSFIKNIHQP